MMSQFVSPNYNLTTVQQPDGKILFREEQVFRQTWVWILILCCHLLPLVMLMIAFLTTNGPEAKEIGSALLVLLVTITFNVALFYWTKLETIITDEGVFYRWRPFRKKYTALHWSSLQAVIVKKFPYPAYGYHYSIGFGKVHNIKGNRGVQFILTNGKRIYLGTQRIAAMQHALESIRQIQVAVETK